MSIHLMTLAWRSGAPTGQKMVLLALCDHADDEGECRPSVPYLARKTSLGESTVRQHITTMEQAGILRRQYRTGRSTYYYIHPEHFTPPVEDKPRPVDTPSPQIPAPPESGAPQNLAPTPAETGGEPPQNLAPTPAESGPRTISKPSKEPSGKPKKGGEATVDAFLPKGALIALGVSEKTIDAWLEHRRDKKAKVTALVLEGFVREAAAARISLDAALCYSIESGWVFFRASWYTKNQGQAPGATSGQGKFSPTAYVNQHRNGSGQ